MLAIKRKIKIIVIVLVLNTISSEKIYRRLDLQVYVYQVYIMLAIVIIKYLSRIFKYLRFCIVD